MAPGTECLPHQHKPKRLDPQKPHKSWAGMVACLYSPCLGGGDGELSEASWARPAESGKLNFHP